MNKLDRVINDIDYRLTRIEEHLGISHEIKEFAEKTNNLNKKLSSNENIQKTKSSSFKFDSSSVLALVGISFVILAGVFFIKNSIESGWLTPSLQIILAAATGISFFFLPQFFPRAEQEYGAILAGAGTTILHLTWLGAFFYHKVMSAHSALICASLVGILSLLAKFKSGNRIYVLIAMAGTYLSAPLIGYDYNNIKILSIFLIIWNISFSLTSIIFKRRDILFFASYFAVFTVILLSGDPKVDYNYIELLSLQLIQFLIFASAMFYFSFNHKQNLSSDEGVAILPLLLLFYISVSFLVSRINPAIAPWIGMVIGLVVLGVYFFAKKSLSDELKSAAALTTFSSITFVHSFYFQLLDIAYRPIVGLIIGVFVLFGLQKSIKSKKYLLWPLGILFSTFIYGAITTMIAFKSSYNNFGYNLIYGLVVLGAIIILTSKNEIKSKLSSEVILFYGFAHLEIMLGLYRLSEKLSWSGALFVTITWGFYAIIILLLSYWKRDKILGNSALVILLAVSLKAFFYDLRETGSLIRIVCLFAEGLLIYFCGWIFKKMQSWR